ncbi:hypothetical protein [Streptomyces sp. NPDC059783]|uniref:hypothetical protein n=1 Tax=Streptomyces sp. NPDC059783 TaxID=3346944 RepID=UPI0036594EDA
MSDRDQLLHLADRARRGVLLPDEGALLADAVTATLDRLDRLRRSRDLWADHTARLTERADTAEAALAALHEGEEPRLDERIVPTPAQWIWLWNRATPAKRAEVAGMVLDASARVDRCILANHEPAIERWRDRAQRAEVIIARVRDLHTRVLRMEALVCACCGHTWPCPTARALDEQQPTTTEAGPTCICGDPIQLRDAIDPSSWIHSPGSDTPCFNARPQQQPTA